MTKNQWKNRIIRQETVPISDIVPNAKNWRKHPQKQQKHVKGSLDNIGWFRSVLVNLRTSDEWEVPHRNKKTVIDGHLRLDLALRNGEDKIPVEYVDLTPDEEKIALASIDPLTAMAETDEKMFEDLMISIDTEVPEIQDLLSDISISFEDIELEVPDHTATSATPPQADRSLTGPAYSPQFSAPHVTDADIQSTGRKLEQITRKPVTKISAFCPKCGHEFEIGG